MIFNKSKQIDDKTLNDINVRSQPFFKYLHIIKNILSNIPTPLSHEKYSKNDLYQLKTIIENDILNKKHCQKITLQIQSKSPQTLIPLPSIPKPFSLIRLPETYTELLEVVTTSKCTICGISGTTIIQNAAICMSCGCLLCYYDKKKENPKLHSETPIFDHQEECSGEIGIYFIVETATIVILSPQYNSIVRNVYINEFGESPKMFMTKGTFKLDHQLLEKIEYLYLTGQITSSPEMTFYVKQYH